MRPGTPGFVGARLREAREARELTASALADLLGVSRQAVSQYENDAQSPAPPVMRRITEVLRLPYHFFSASPSPAEDDVIFYRSLATATKAARLRAERRYTWLRSIVRYLRELVQFPIVNFPDLNFPADPRKISECQIEQAAAQTRAFWGLKDHSISNLTWLVENNGAIVSRHELSSDKLDAFSQWNRADSTPYVVLGSDKGSAVRSRYDVAHELGHMILHRRVPKESFSEKSERSLFKLIERQADRFAGAFILPESTFSREFLSPPTLDHFRTLKPKWKASIQFMIMRSCDLGIITPERKSQLFANLSARGWRTKEPMDDVIKPEEPRFLSRSIRFLIDRGVIPPSEIPFRLRLDEGDIEELTGLEPWYFRNREREMARFPTFKNFRRKGKRRRWIGVRDHPVSRKCLIADRLGDSQSHRLSVIGFGLLRRTLLPSLTNGGCLDALSDPPRMSTSWTFVEASQSLARSGRSQS